MKGVAVRTSAIMMEPTTLLVTHMAALLFSVRYLSWRTWQKSFPMALCMVIPRMFPQLAGSSSTERLGMGTWRALLHSVGTQRARTHIWNIACKKDAKRTCLCLLRSASSGDGCCLNGVLQCPPPYFKAIFPTPHLVLEHSQLGSS